MDVQTFEVKVKVGVGRISWSPVKGVIIKSIDYSYGTQPSKILISIPLIDENTISMPPELGNIQQGGAQFTYHGTKQIQTLPVGEGECTIEVSINDAKVFGGIVTDASLSFSEQGHLMEISASDYRILLTRAVFYGEYNNKDNPFSLPVIEELESSSDQNTKYIPRYTASYIIRQIMQAYNNFNNTLNLTNKILSLQIYDPDGYLGGEEDIIKVGSNAVETGPLVFDGQNCLEAIQMVLQAVGNYRLYCDPEGVIHISKAGQSTKIIQCKFGENVVNYNLSKTINRITSVLVKGEKYRFSGQEEVELDTDDDNFPNVLIKEFSGGWSEEKGKFIVGMQLSPGWTDSLNPYYELEQPYTITLPGTDKKISPLVVEKWKMASDGKTIIGVESARPMTIAEGAFFTPRLILRGGAVYIPESDVFRRWVIKDIYGRRVGLLRESLFEGTTQDKDSNGNPILGELSEETIESIAINTEDPFEERLAREVSIGIDILVEHLWYDPREGKIKGTIIRPSKEDYTIDYLRGEIYFRDPIKVFGFRVSEDIKGILLPYEYIDKYSYISNRDEVSTISYNNEKFVEYFSSQGTGELSGSLMKDLEAMPRVFVTPYKKDGVYWIPRVWATFYYKEEAELPEINWIKQETDDKDVEIYYSDKGNYVLVQIHRGHPGIALKPASTMAFFTSDKVWEEAEGELGYYVHVGSPLTKAVALQDRYVEKTYVFRHRDERDEMVKMAKAKLEPEKVYSGTIQLAVFQKDIASGPNLGIAELSNHPKYSGRSFIESANLQLTERGFFITLELGQERFRLGKTPEQERKRKIDVYYRIGKWSKSHFSRTLSPISPEGKTGIQEQNVGYDGS